MEEKISKMLTVIAALLVGVFLLLAYSTFISGPATQYEYASLWLPDLAGSLDKLNEAGSLGWEVISLRRANDSENDTWGYEFWLKRPK